VTHQHRDEETLHMTKKLIPTAMALLAPVAALMLAAPAAAQTFPSKPLRWIVPSAPGDGSDITGRIVAERVSRELGQQVLIDNKPGAGGVVGSEAAAKSPADGYTMIVGNAGSHGINAAIYTKLNYDVARDFVPVALFCTAPNVMVASPGTPVKTVAEFVAYAKANPGKLNYASGGIGSSSHLSAELLKSMAGFDMTHVPYKGAAHRGQRGAGQRGQRDDRQPAALAGPSEGRQGSGAGRDHGHASRRPAGRAGPGRDLRGLRDGRLVRRARAHRHAQGGGRSRQPGREHRPGRPRGAQPHRRHRLRPEPDVARSLGHPRARRHHPLEEARHRAQHPRRLTPPGARDGRHDRVAALRDPERLAEDELEFRRAADERRRPGLGEASLNAWEPMLSGAVELLERQLVGLTLDAAHATLTVSPYSPGGLVQATAISAAQQALVELTARAQGKPWHAPLGPLRRQRLPAYANINRATTERTPAGFVATARRAAAQGFRAFKAAPFDGVTPATCASAKGLQRTRHGIDCLLALREAIGPEARLMVDCHWRFDETRALEVLQALAPARLHWFECPLPETPPYWPALQRVHHAARDQGVLLAAAETQIGRAGFQPLFDAELYDVVMPDVKYCGGPWEMLRIAERAQAAGVQFSPHNPTGPIASLHSLNVASVAPSSASTRRTTSSSRGASCWAAPRCPTRA
jgi:galactonate dehydratase